MNKILIANRGEIAVRIIRACQEMGFKTVAVHSTADRDSLHAKLADESVCIGPGPSARSYLNIPAIMCAAELVGADAIHPGYGFLSENADFAQVCEDHDFVFIGPKPENIRGMGHKVRAREVARRIGVPLLPGTPEPISDLRKAEALALEIGLPVIIKAAAGGGGRGMKIVWQKADLVQQIQVAQSEAQAFFGDGCVYLEKYLSKPRHVEVQIVADQYGHTFHLGERDCSIQRRHQKLIEEAPCPVLTPELRKQVCDYAVSLARAVDYQSLGTVEFLYEDGQFYFMEMNTRIQVEHPVTELVTGVDLVKTQIRIAQGETIDLSQVVTRGHAMECRINAEDPETFAPWPGKVTDYHVPGGPGVRIDSMLYAGYTVPSLYDSMIAKLLTFGIDREECMARMQRSLREIRVGGIRTNTAFHLRLLDDPGFRTAQVYTSYLQDFLNYQHPQ